jgi:hypothetical protein
MVRKALEQLRGELEKWLQENKLEGLVVRVFTNAWGIERMGKDEESSVTW